MHLLIRSAVVLVTGASISLIGLSPSTADPSGPDPAFPLVCDNGQTYSVVTSGNGDFTPAHDVESTKMLIPVEFGEFHFTVRDSTGAVIDEETEPPATKGQSSKSGRTTTTCTFSFDEFFEDPDLGTLHVEGGGSVTVFVTPAR
jgi:hypothetical protein